MKYREKQLKVCVSKESIPFPNNIEAKYSMIDLFAFIGGTRLGFHLTERVKTVFSSEIDKFAKETYFRNFGEEPEGDIQEISSTKIPDHDILVAGFPCQAFSQAGKKEGFKDKRGFLLQAIRKLSGSTSYLLYC